MIVVRQAEPGDAEALVQLGRAVGSEPEGWLISVDGWRGAAEERRYLRAIRRYPHAAVFVAEDEEEGELIGRISLARDQHPASYHVADLGLMVSANRRQGIGRALLEAAVGWARDAGVTKLELHVFPSERARDQAVRAVRLQREGFRKADYRRGDGQFADAILMAYRIE